jgi:hypothetical protein
MDSTWILDKKLAGLPPKKKLSKLHMDSGNPPGVHLESRWNLWLRVKSSSQKQEIRYSQGSAIVTTGRYEFWNSNVIWNRISVGGWQRSRGLRIGEGNSMTLSVGMGDMRWWIGVWLIA